MNKKTSLLVIAATLALVGAGCKSAATVVKPPPAVAPVESASQPQTASVPNPTLLPMPQEVSTGALHVTWSAAKPVAPVDVFTATYEHYTSGGTDHTPDYLRPERYQQVGVVADGPYAGSRVVIVHMDVACSMGGDSVYHFLLPVSGKPVMLAKHSPDYRGAGTDDPVCSDFDGRKFIVDTTAEAPELMLPVALTYAGARFRLTQSSNWDSVGPQIGTQPLDMTHKKLAFIDPTVGKVWTDAHDGAPNIFAQDGFYVAAADGTIRTYVLDIPFYDEHTHIADAKWTDGTPIGEEYWAYDVGGCGAQNDASVMVGTKKADLSPVGVTAQGDAIYQFKNPADPHLKELYDKQYVPWHQNGEGAAVLSFEAFVKAKPIFLWIDPIGRVLKFQKASFLPAAECGKPVIYLYPPKTENVSVKLDPQGGFTKSEPGYDGGWDVRATPQGELTNLKDGKTYPYLFWEGRGGLYRTPGQGWSVAQKDVHAFLSEKLSALGLNAKERADFMEFWEPRMQGSPYYFVTFLGNRAMDALAPMAVTPKPDSVIRILMDFRPLAAPVVVQGFEIRTPKRDGFTVVEWGGVLR